jgi:hypothetical protein
MMTRMPEYQFDYIQKLFTRERGYDVAQVDEYIYRQHTKIRELEAVIAEKDKQIDYQVKFGNIELDELKKKLYQKSWHGAVRFLASIRKVENERRHNAQ